MYEFLLSSHSILRWLILPIGLFVISTSWFYLKSEKPYGKLEKISGGILVGLAHLQLIIGLLLYFVFSPDINAALNDMGAAMKDAHLRLKILEHPLISIIAVALIQIGRSLSKKATDNVSKRKKVAIYTTIAFVLILSRIPNWQ